MRMQNLVISPLLPRTSGEYAEQGRRIPQAREESSDSRRLHVVLSLKFRSNRSGLPIALKPATDIESEFQY